jgi:signal transduction histidine kinase
MNASRWRLTGLLAAGVLLVVLPFLASLGSSTVPDLAPVDRLAIGVALTFAAGMLLRTRSQDRRLSWLVLLLAATFSAKGLTGSASPEVFTSGLLLGQLSLPMLVWIGLALPSGRLRSRWDRFLVLGALVSVTVLWVPTQLFTAGPLFLDPLLPCGATCQQSALFVVDRPGLATNLEVVFQVGVGLVSLAVGWTLARRMLSASRPMRRTLLPIFVVALLRFVIVTEFVLLARNPYSQPMLTVTYWLVPIAIMTGLLLGRLTTARAMLRLVSGLERRPDASRLRDVMADALEDPNLAIYYWLPGHGAWAGPGGVVAAEALTPAPGRTIERVEGEGGLLAAIDVDERLSIDPEPWGAVMATARIAMEGNRAIADLALSEARAETAEHRARRDLERDLHDGAQQRLVALRMKVSMLRSLLDQDIRRAADLADELGPDLEAALQEVRAVGHGNRPEALADGLVEALRRMVGNAPVAATFTSLGVSRYPASVEEAVYFTCLEALQNAAKHAGPAGSAQVALREADGELSLEVRDNGPGFDVGSQPASQGRGLANMRERFAGVGGTLTVESSGGGGVRVRGVIPLN